MLAVRITEERERHGGSALLAHVSRAEGGSSSSFAPSLDPTGLDRERRQMHEELRSAAGIRRSDAALLQHLETKHVGSAPFSIALAKLREQDTRDIPLLTYVVAVACAVATEPEAARLPEDAAAVVASTLQALDLGVLEKKVPVSAGAAGRERQQAQWIARRQVVAERSNAVAALLEVLLGLVRRRPEDEAYMRSLVMMDSLCEDGWLRCLLRLMCEGADVGTVVTAADASTSSTCAPFEKGCQLLAHLARDSEEVAKVLVGAGVLKVVGSLISRSTGNANRSASSPSVDLGTEWLPFVTAAVCLIDAVVAEEDVDRFQISNPSLFRPMWAAGDRPAAFVDGIMAALDEKKKDKKKGKKKSKGADKKKDKKKDKKSKKAKDAKKRKASSSSDSSSNKKKSKKKKKDKDIGDGQNDEARETWIFGREEAIRKAEPGVSEAEALQRAVAEYCQLFGDGQAEEAPMDVPDSDSDVVVENEEVAKGVTEAMHQATEKALAAGKSESDAKKEARQARKDYLAVAMKAGLIKEAAVEKVPMFVQEKERLLRELVKKGVPSTDDRPRSISAGETSYAKSNAHAISKLKLF